MQNHDLIELQQKTKDELIEIILEFQETQKMANTDVHVISTLDKLKEHPSLEAHINKVYNNSKNVSVLMFRIYNIDKSDDIFNASISRKILNDVTKIVKSHMRSMDILIKYNEQNFVIIAPNTDEEGIYKYAVKLKEMILSHEFAKISHLQSNFCTTLFEQNDSVNSVINRLHQALLELEKDSVHHIIHV